MEIVFFALLLPYPLLYAMLEKGIMFLQNLARLQKKRAETKLSLQDLFV
jgi:hypothetical protein